jgi:hypothetical protein
VNFQSANYNRKELTSQERGRYFYKN